MLFVFGSPVLMGAKDEIIERPKNKSRHAIIALCCAEQLMTFMFRHIGPCYRISFVSRIVSLLNVIINIDIPSLQLKVNCKCWDEKSASNAIIIVNMAVRKKLLIFLVDTKFFKLQYVFLARQTPNAISYFIWNGPIHISIFTLFFIQFKNRHMPL